MKQPLRQSLPDFETWMNLAKEDPSRFEALRQKTIDDFITQVPENKQLHLRRVQWRVDQARQRAGTPLAACVALSRMMWDSFSELRDTYYEVLEQGQEKPVKRLPPRSAQVLEFRRFQPAES